MRRAHLTPPMTPRELARWSWRQLTSMRTALILLFAYWRPMGGVVWDVRSPGARGLL